MESPAIHRQRRTQLRSEHTMLKAVIFDVDGTLVDSVDAHARSWWETLAEFGHDVDYQRVRHQIGKGGDQLMREFLSDAEIRENGGRIEKARKDRYMRRYIDGVRGFPKVRELFQHIRDSGRRVALASSAGGDEIGAYKEKTRIADLVEEETSKDDVERSKPHPDIFQAALDQLCGVRAAESIVVGDTPWDAIAAKRAGLRMVGVLCGGFDEKELREAGCIAIFQSPADLLARFDESPLGA